MCHKFLIKSKISVQVSFWRFKWLTRDSEGKIAGKYAKIIAFLGRKEDREDTIGKKSFLSIMKYIIDINKHSRMYKSLDNFSSMIEKTLMKNIQGILKDSEMFSNSEMMIK